MIVQLIPVLDIQYGCQDVLVPDKYPYWEHASIWNSYYQECYSRSGFQYKMTPYLPGSSFIRQKDISNNNLIKLVKDHTEDSRKGQRSREQASGFFGGYVLSIDG